MSTEADVWHELHTGTRAKRRFFVGHGRGDCAVPTKGQRREGLPARGIRVLPSNSPIRQSYLVAAELDSAIGTSRVRDEPRARFYLAHDISLTFPV